jgi:hypothetical protein
MVKNGKFTSFAFVKCADFDESKPPTRDDFNLRAALKAVSNQFIK